MDLLYDECYDGSGAHSSLKEDGDEDSMDIYSGLGDTPTHTTETPSMLFSPRAKQSMDLYEEILTEEVKSKDSSYEELKTRFLAAQNQIQELRKRLGQTETQNTGLSSENLRLKKNLSSLLKTARQEVLRKDEEIKKLNQRLGTNVYNPHANGQWRTFPNNPTNKPPPFLPPPQPGAGNAFSTTAPPSRASATPAATPPPYPPGAQHWPRRTSSTTSSTPSTPQPRWTSLTCSTSKSAATPTNLPPPQHRPNGSSSITCRPPALPTDTSGPSLPRPQPNKTPSSLSTACKPSPPLTNPPPPKRQPSTTSSTSSCRPPAPPTESALPPPSQPGLSKKCSSISSTFTPSAPPTNPSLPSSRPLSQPFRTSRISTSKEPAPPPPPSPPVLKPRPPSPPSEQVCPVSLPPPPPPPVLQPRPPSPPSEDVCPYPPPRPVPQPRPPSPLSEEVCPESLPPPPPPEKIRDGVVQQPDAIPHKCSSRLESKETDKQQKTESQSELPELGELDTSKPSKYKEQEPKSQTPSEATDKRLKSSLGPNKDCDTNHRNRSRRAEKESRNKHTSHKLLKSSCSQDAEKRHSSETATNLHFRSQERKQDDTKPESNYNGTEPKESRLKDSSRENRKDKHADKTSEKKQSSSSKDRRNYTTKQHVDGNVESSKRKGNRTDPPVEDRRNTERQREDDNGRRERRSEKRRHTDRKRSKDEGRRKAESREAQKKSLVIELEVPTRTDCLKENSPTRKLKENSPTRKLCFMETLNLTLSPVKKPQIQQNDCVPQEVTQKDGKEDGEIGSKDDDDVLNLEEFLIIDEIESSTNELEIRHDMEQSPKPSSASQTSTKNCAIEDVEKDQSLTTTETSRVVVSEQPEVLPVQSTVECGLPQAKESIYTDRPTLNAPVVAQESRIISKLPVENTSPNNPVDMEELETLSPHEAETGSISEVCKCSPSENNNPGKNHSEFVEPAEPIVLESGVKTGEHELHENQSTAPGDKDKWSCPCPITSPEEVEKTVSCLSPITSPVPEEVEKTLSCLSPIAGPVRKEVNKITSCPCIITGPVSDEVNKKGSPEGPQSPRNDPLKPPASMWNPTHKGGVDHQESSPKCSDTVSSTITQDALSQGHISLPEAIYVLTHTDNSSGDSILPDEPGPSVSCVGVSKVSSTTEDTTSPGKLESVRECTPVKGYGVGDRHQHRPGTEKDEASAEPSSSVPLFYDEDSMMLMLKNLRSIPNMISPLRSPMLRAKRVLAHFTATKPPHVKSLQKDFFSTAVVSNSTTLKLNKETKYQDDPLTQEPQPVIETTLIRLPVHSDRVSASSSDLEEGEILSDSNEADLSPPKLTRPANDDNKKNNKPSPKSMSRTAKQSAKETRVSSKGPSESPSPSTASPSSGKSRFKKVCTAGEQSCFTTMEEVMEALKKVRFHIRKKYMKLHKVFPKKSFYAMMDHFQQSFLEFVESAIFGEISCQVSELKARLRKLVWSVFSKVMNNGIVNRIFDLQETSLKQRIWEFVDVQLDYLFRDIQLALKTFCKPSVKHNTSLEMEQKVVNPRKNGKIHKKFPVNTLSKKSRSPKGKSPVQTIQRRIQPCSVVPSKTGLGRGKDIRIICMERQNADPGPNAPGFFPHSIPLTPEKGHRTSLVISHNSTTQDRSDFEILTEQQASSLTFNLVRDTQMGEIFKCLMQGSDLLDASLVAGDTTSWSLSTPRKECLPGDSLLSITSPSKLLSPSKFSSPRKFGTPTKFVTSPSKLITTWSSVLPSKLCSPQPKLLHMPLNSAMFDESCLLELPSSSRSTAQRSYSFLAEDLALSLTIPSPLKSDSHLSFLQPRTMNMMSTPESVISAHLGEEALLGSEDAWEQQDLHLALDTDNSDSSCSSARDSPTPVLFQFKPHLSMQAVVMERSNDHFIVKIRQSPLESANITLTADDSLSRTLTEEDPYQGETEPDVLVLHKPELVPKALFLEKSFRKEPSLPKPPPPSPEETIPAVPESPEAKTSVKELPSHPSESTSSADEMGMSTASEGRLAIVEYASSSGTPKKEAMGKVCRKRKMRHEKTKAKRAKKEEERGGKKLKKVTSARSREPSSSKQEKESPPKTPPSSLSAKNVVKKKGEVVVAWTRDEDRAILLDLKTKGASRETFSILSEKINKSSAQIEERFSQLMKLFKKQEKIVHSSP